MGFFYILVSNENKNWLEMVVKPIENDNFYVLLNLEMAENDIVK